MNILRSLIFDPSQSPSLLRWTKIFRTVPLVRLESLLLDPLLPPLLFELFELFELFVRGLTVGVGPRGLKVGEGPRGFTVGEGPRGLTVGDDPPPL